MTAPFEAEIPRFSDQSQRNSKISKKFDCKMVDYHWDQLVLGLGYHFFSFLDPKIGPADFLSVNPHFRPFGASERLWGGSP